METEALEPIKVVLVSMDERSIARMETIFKVVYKGRCELAHGEDANLAIVDIDFETNAWEKCQRQYPGLPAIIMSETPVDLDGATYVAKPAKLDLLWTSIFNLVTGLPQVNEIIGNLDSEKAKKTSSGKTTISSAASSIDAQFDSTSTVSKVSSGKSASEETSLYFNPDEYLLGLLVSSIKKHIGKDCAIHVQCWSDRQLILLPDQGRVYTDLTDSQFKNLGIATLNKEFSVDINSVCGVGKSQLPTGATDGLQSMPINHLIWDLALRTSRGRLPLGTDLSVPHYLQCWPNFTRLPRTLQGMRIASLWVGNPRTLDDIAMNLGIDHADVYSFYSAAAAIGLAGPAKRQVDKLIAPRDVMNNEISAKGLLASILRHVSK